MLNEKRIVSMTKMAIYNQGEKKKDMKVCSFYKKDYIIYQSILAGLWYTVGYVIIVGLYLVSKLDYFTSNLSLDMMVELAVLIVVGYVVILVFFEIIAIFFYYYKYGKALKSAKGYYQTLEKLNAQYKKETKNGTDF